MAKTYQKRKWETKSVRISKSKSAPAIRIRKLIEPKVEIYKEEKYYILRNKNNKIIAKRKVKGSKISLSEAKTIYKQNKTFYQNWKRNQFFKNGKPSLMENIYIVKSNNQNTKTIPYHKQIPRNKDKFTVVYHIEGYILMNRRRVKVNGNSLSMSKRATVTGERYVTRKTAREDALLSFYANVGKVTMGTSDDEAGRQAFENGQVFITHEGWIWYR
jgi:hypothetical protein